MNDNISMDTEIEGSMNDNINMDTEIEGSMNDNINMDTEIEGSSCVTPKKNKLVFVASSRRKQH